MSADSITVTYDPGLLKFLFSPSVEITGGTAMTLIGWPEDVVEGEFTESPYFVNLSPPTNIVVKTDLSIYDIQSGNTLGVVPVTGEYGDFIQYNDYDGKHPYLMVDHNRIHITIYLQDDEGNPLEDRMDEDWLDAPTNSLPPWSVTLALVPMDNDGFEGMVNDTTTKVNTPTYV